MNKVIKKAFTLIELLVVIAIIGILSGLIVVSMGGMTQKATIAKAQVFSNSLRNSLIMSLVSEWKFDGSITDSWKGTNNGTWYGSAGGTNAAINYRPTTECVSGQCLSFDGTDDYVDMGNPASLNFGINDFSFEVWIKTSNAAYYNRVMSKRVSVGGAWYSLTLNLNTGNPYFEIGGGIGPVANIDIRDGQWHHIAATRNYAGATGRIYVDGIDKTFGTPTGMNLNVDNTASFRVGQWNDSQFFNGLIDSLRFYNFILSTSQIKEQYYTGLNNLLKSGGINKEEYLSRVNELAIK